MSHRFLFIGGPAHGQVLEVSTPGKPVETPTCVGGNSWETALYQPQEMGREGGVAKFRFYAYTPMSKDEAHAKLFVLMCERIMADDPLGVLLVNPRVPGARAVYDEAKAKGRDVRWDRPQAEVDRILAEKEEKDDG